MTVASLFDRAAQSYDHARRQLVPCFDDLYGTALELLPADHSAALRILDVGAGTGLFSAFIAQRYPHAHIVLIDLAADMLAQAAERLAPFGERIRIEQLDMREARNLGTFDVVVSALAIHHLDDQGKQALFHDMFAMLSPDGRFVHVEQILGPTRAIEQQYQTMWLETARAKGAQPQDILAAQERMRYDRTVPLDTQLDWLRATGFEQVNCWYQWYRFAVYSGDKPSALS